jgi:hypothetical protein
LGVVRVLIVEDKVKLTTVLRRGLRKEGLSADIAATGEDAAQHISLGESGQRLPVPRADDELQAGLFGRAFPRVAPAEWPRQSGPGRVTPCRPPGVIDSKSNRPRV